MFLLLLVQNGGESNIHCVWLYLGSREYWLFDLTLAERKDALAIPTVVVERQCHSSVVAELNMLQMDLFNEEEPNDDYEPYAMRQRPPHGGGPLMMTTQVTTKVPPGFDEKTSWFAFEDAIDDWCDMTELESEKWP